MIEKTLTIPESILKAENMSYDNSNSGLNATDTQAAIDEINSKSDIKVFAESPMTNTSDGVVKFNEIGGVTEQKTYQGYNMLDMSNAKGATSYGITVTPNVDGSYSYVGTAENDAINVWLLGKYSSTEVLFTLPAGTYFIKGVTLFYDATRINNAGRSGEIITFTEDMSITSIRVVGAVPGTSYNETIYPIITKSDVELPWEPYTGGIASPNPDYPQEIKPTVVTGVKTHGKNICKSCSYRATATNSYALITGATMSIKKGLTYTISVELTADSATKAFWHKVTGIFGSSHITFNVSSGTTRYSYTFEAQADYVYGGNTILAKSATDDGILITPSNLMVELGDTATTYEPYQESTIEFSKPITLYGDPDVAVQDILNTKQVERKYVETIFDGSIDEVWSASSMVAKRYAYSGLGGMGAKAYQALLCTQAKGTIKSTETTLLNMCSIDGNYTFFINTDFATLDDWKAHLSAKPMKIIYELAEPIIEPLPEVDQLALTQLKTFEGVTYVEFISDIQPTFKAESSTTQEGSYVLDLLARTNSVEKQVEALDDTLLYAQEDILDLEEAFHIPEVTDTVLDGSYPGLLKVNEIGGKMEQFSTSGKNLVEPLLPTITSSKGVTCTNNGDGTFTLNGIATDVVTFRIDQDSISGTNNLKTYSGNYTISVRDSNGNVNPSGIELVLMQQDTYVIYLTSNGKATAEVNADKCFIYIYVANGTNLNNLKVYPQLEIGSEITSWEPYTGGQASPNPSYPQEIKCIKGKNLLDCRGLSEETINGGTFTPVYDEYGNLEYVEVNGTFTALTTYNIGVFYPNVDETYIITDGGTTNVNLKLNRTDIIIPSGSYTWEPSASETYKELIVIRVESGKTVNEKIYPMIRPASVADPTYVPYGLLRVKTRNAQLFNVYDYRYENKVTHEIHESGKKIVVKGSVSRALMYYILDIKRYQGKTITVSCNITKTVTDAKLFVGFAVTLADGGKKYYNISNTSGKFSKEFTMPDDIIAIQLNFNVNDTTTDLSAENTVTIEDFMISDCGITTYEPYTESSYTFSEPIDLYGTDDVQDVITAKPIKRRFGVDVFNGSENWNASSFVGRYFVYNLGCKKGGAVLCSQAKRAVGSTEIVNTCYLPQSTDGRFVINTDFATLAEWKAHLASKPMEVVYELAEETTEPLPAVDQIGLNNLLTYSDVTYVEFDCDGPQPTLKAEYPTSKENSYILESLLNTRTNALNQELINNKIAALEATIVSNI